MGGRGGYSENVSGRANDVLSTMRSAGMNPQASSKQTEKIIKDLDNARMKEYMHITHIGNYQKGFNRTASAENKKGYKEEKNRLLQQISNNPSKVEQISTKAQNKYRNELASIEKAMSNAGDGDYSKLLKKRENAFGKFQAANFINWSIKKK